MTPQQEAAAESIGTLAAKAAPPVGVSIATVAGYHINEIVLWLTAIYTVLMILHKLVQIWGALRGKQ